MIAVLRLGHRPDRDKRVTTHVALVARAFGADKIFVDREDKKLEQTIRDVCRRFGGNFEIETGVNWKGIIREWNGKKIHLTMYGKPLREKIDEIRKERDILIIVGAEKVPGEVYRMVDYNISIGNQPHSEVSALAIFLDRYTSGKWEYKKFDGEIEIIPSEKRKKVVKRKKLPSEEECIDMLSKQGCSQEVIDHCISVKNLAVKIAELAGADVELVKVGALLHDIGRSRTHGISHGIEGAKIARELNLPDEVVNIIERHIGAGLTKEEAVKLGLPPKDYTPKTLEEKIVAHADNLIDGNRKQKISEEVERQLKKGNKDYAERLMKLHRELSQICGIDLDEI